LIAIAGIGLLLGRFRPKAEPEAQFESAYTRGDWHSAAALARETLRGSPNDPLALRLAARVAARQDQDQKALAIYQRLDPASNQAEDLFLQGRAWIRAGKLDLALKSYEAAREKDSDHAETLVALAGLYLQTDRFHAAAEAAQQLARQPQWEARAQVMLGTARAEIADPASAAAALRRWAELDPHGQAVAPYPAASLRKYLARLWLQSGQPSEARPVLESILAAGPDREASWLLGRCYLQEKDWKRAAADQQQEPSYRSEHPTEPEPARYLGEARCAECHREQLDAVLASRHATTFARAAELAEFTWPEAPQRDPGNAKVTHQLRREGNSLIVETSANQKTFRAVVDYAFGSLDRFATFVGHDDQGRSRMIRISPYQTSKGQGWDTATGLRRQPADDREYLGKMMVEGDGVRRCLNCHTTSAYLVLHEAGPASADHSIGCERCHGPGGNHVAAVSAGFSDLAIGCPDKGSPAEIGEICAGCHGPHQPEGLNTPRTDPLWLRFQSPSLSWSRCYTESRGALGCMTCHDPHRKLETSAAWYEAKCLSCHGPGSTDGSTGSPHAEKGRHPKPTEPAPVARTGRTRCPVNPTRGCVACHLPRVWVQSTHSFKADHYIRIHDKLPAEAHPTGSTDRVGHE
jgi:tetratricopeptide (TPR) repeat protein